MGEEGGEGQAWGDCIQTCEMSLFACIVTVSQFKHTKLGVQGQSPGGGPGGEAPGRSWILTT